MGKREIVEVSAEELVMGNQTMEIIRKMNEAFTLSEGRQKRAMIQTMGCQQNENDSEKIKGMLYRMGYTFTDQSSEADLILYNTCCVRENAELKVFGHIGALKKLKEDNTDLIIGLCGCMMQQEHIVEKIRQKYKQVDMVFGTQALHKFPIILQKAMEEKGLVVDTEMQEGYIAEDLPILRESKVKAWVSIMFGCNNFCSYCIVPYVRGRERSRKPADILREVRELSDSGVRDITLLGQNVNSYGKDLAEPIDFADLVEQIDRLGLPIRIRFMTSHPKDISDKLIEVMAKSSSVCEQLHLPVQAGNNDILKGMNRKYTREQYLEIIQKVKEKIPNVAITSDIIVGFPGETVEQFEDTLSLIREVGYDLLFTFIYSRRKGTPAEKLPDVLSDKEKQKNFEKLVEVQNEISLKKNQALLGQTVEVLVEGESKNDQAVLSGRTRGGKLVHFEGDEKLIGQFVNVQINKVNTWALTGQLI